MIGTGETVISATIYVDHLTTHASINDLSGHDLRRSPLEVAKNRIVIDLREMQIGNRSEEQ
jgi:hypothetical protein